MPDLAFPLTVVAGIVVFVGYLRLTSWHRDRKLTRLHPGATVVNGGGNSSLRQVIKDAEASGAWPSSIGSLSLSFSIVADASGVSFWNIASSPAVSLPWELVNSVVPTTVLNRGQKSRGILLTASPRGRKVVLPLIVLGSGLFGMYPLRAENIEKMCHQLEITRLAAAMN